MGLNNNSSKNDDVKSLDDEGGQLLDAEHVFITDVSLPFFPIATCIMQNSSLSYLFPHTSPYSLQPGSALDLLLSSLQNNKLFL